MLQCLHIAIPDEPFSLLSWHDMAGILLQEKGAARQDYLSAVLPHPHRELWV